MTKISKNGLKWNLRLLEVLKDHTIKNALEVARDTEYWAEGDNEESRQRFIEAIVRCQEGDGTAEDWNWLVDETQM